jgi:hypothetical protein
LESALFAADMTSFLQKGRFAIFFSQKWEENTNKDIVGWFFPHATLESTTKVG